MVCTQKARRKSHLGWLESHGSIIFGQYFDTAEWVALALTAAFPKIPIGLYAGHGNSFVYKGGERIFAERELLKQKVKDEETRAAKCRESCATSSCRLTAAGRKKKSLRPSATAEHASHQTSHPRPIRVASTVTMHAL
jgi:hypothetical protein